MVKAVCDSSTLILLARVGVLRHLFLFVDEVLIPEAVFLEVVVAGKKANKLDAFIVEKEIEKGNIKVVTLGRKSFADGLMQDFRIDLGEAESIALSIERNVLFLGIDDKEAIKVCRVYGVPFLTALAFVVKLAKEKQIQKEEAALALNKLQQICLFSDEVMKEALKEGGLNGRSD